MVQLTRRTFPADQRLTLVRSFALSEPQSSEPPGDWLRCRGKAPRRLLLFGVTTTTTYCANLYLESH